MSSGFTRDEVTIAAPLPQQVPIVESAARFKVVRAGRRFGKTRLALFCAIVGHGPNQMFPGIVSGKDVAWVAPEYKNSDVIWEEDIKPRFRSAVGVKTNDTDHILEIPGGGRLVLITAKNIDAVRGIGKNLAGVIVDEAGHMDLGYAMRAVLRPALMDRKGWTLFMSTTNSGWDGNCGDDGEKIHPSYFNRLCTEIAEGKRDNRWQEFYGTAFDNPKLDRQEINDLIAEYVAGSLDLDQEVYARLRAPGAGLAFPEWLDELHVIPTREPPRHWKYAAAMDWGYRQGSYGLYAFGPEGQIEKVWEYYADFRQKHARQAAIAIRKASEHFPVPEYIAADTQMWSEIGSAETVAEEFNEGLQIAYGEHAPPLLEMEHRPNSRKPKKNLVHRYLAYTRDDSGVVQPWNRPLLRVQQRCEHTIRTIKALPLDPNKPDDVDTSAEDHCLAGDTLVDTAWGPRRIDAMRPGFDNEVIGPNGEFLWCGTPRLTRKDAPIVRVTFSDGRAIRCTPDHRILTADGWTEAGALQPDDYVCTSQTPLPSATPFRSSREPATTAAANTSSGKEYDSTGSCGASAMTWALSRMGTTFTIATTTEATTPAPTWNSSWDGNTSVSTAATPRRPSVTRGGLTLHSPQQEIVGFLSLCAPTRDAVFARVKDVEPCGVADVYDLAVHDPSHAFSVCGGILVHNCYDETAFILSSRPPLAEKSKSPFDQDNQHPGFDYDKRIVKSITQDEDERYGYRVPVSYKIPR